MCGVGRRADAVGACEVAPGGCYGGGVSDRLVKDWVCIRAAGEAAEADRKCRGRDANVEALMRDRGFPVKSDK